MRRIHDGIPCGSNSRARDAKSVSAICAIAATPSWPRSDARFIAVLEIRAISAIAAPPCRRGSLRGHIELVSANGEVGHDVDTISERDGLTLSHRVGEGDGRRRPTRAGRIQVVAGVGGVTVTAGDGVAIRRDGEGRDVSSIKCARFTPRGEASRPAFEVPPVACARPSALASAPVRLSAPDSRLAAKAIRTVALPSLPAVEIPPAHGHPCARGAGARAGGLIGVSGINGNGLGFSCVRLSAKPQAVGRSTRTPVRSAGD